MGEHARALTTAYGRPTWFATEIAAIAAALPEPKFLTGGNMTKGAPCFGTEMDYGQWLPAVRAHKSDQKWWTEQIGSCDCEHAQATWVLGLLVAGNPAVVWRCFLRLPTSWARCPTKKSRPSWQPVVESPRLDSHAA